jgi:hypothetical protein
MKPAKEEGLLETKYEKEVSPRPPCILKTRRRGGNTHTASKLSLNRPIATPGMSTSRDLIASPSARREAKGWMVWIEVVSNLESGNGTTGDLSGISVLRRAALLE